MSNVSGIRRLVATHLWAMVPEYMEAMLDVLQLRASGLRLSDAEIAERIAASNHGALGLAAPRAVSPSSGLVAVLPLYGVIAPKASMINQTSGPSGTSCEAFGAAFDAAMGNDQVSAIVIDVDSPGGTITGVPELFSKIVESRGTKRIVAVASGMAASAAYWLASAADEIAVTPSGEVGSIGVYTVHSDLSGMMAADGVKQTIVKAGKYKAEGHPSQPLGDDTLAAMQERVDEAYGSFVNAVAKGRGVSASDVRSGYGEGRIVSASKAKAMGMVDRIATLDEVVSRLGASRGGPKPGYGRRTMSGHMVAAEVPEPKYAVGERVRAIVNHMPMMKGKAGAIAEAHAGAPAYYAVDFDTPMPGGNPHKWLTEDEIEPEGGTASRRAEIERRKLALADADVAV